MDEPSRLAILARIEAAMAECDRQHSAAEIQAAERHLAQTPAPKQAPLFGAD